MEPWRLVIHCISLCSPAGEGVGEDQKAGHAGFNPRRSNSLGSLSEPDCYMNALWPRLVTTSIQVCGTCRTAVTSALLVVTRK